jgi:hypothetical protein
VTIPAAKPLLLADFADDEKLAITAWLKQEHKVHNPAQFGQWALKGAGKGLSKEQIIAAAEEFNGAQKEPVA